LPAGAPVKVVVYPRERGLTAALLGRLRDRDDEDETTSAGTLQRSLTALRMILAAAEVAFADPGLLRMPSMGDIR
jgi:hypothetical protein